MRIILRKIFLRLEKWGKYLLYIEASKKDFLFQNFNLLSDVFMSSGEKVECNNQNLNLILTRKKVNKL